MITKEQLENASFVSRYKDGSRLLTRTEASYRASLTNNVVVVSDDTVFFYTNDHCFGVGVLSDDFVPVTSYLPLRVVPRPGLEDGNINTLGKYEMVFKSDRKCIETIDALVDYLNSK